VHLDKERQQQIEAEASRLEQRYPHALPDPVPLLAKDGVDGEIVQTPAGQPDFRVTVMSPLVQIVVRGFRTYLQALLGLLAVALVGPSQMLPSVAPRDFLAALQLAAGLALAPAAISVLQNLVEFLAKVDELFPKARA
jgi:hypothetical protein